MNAVNALGTAAPRSGKNETYVWSAGKISREEEMKTKGEAIVKFGENAQGPPFSAHGGSIGAVYLSLANELAERSPPMDVRYVKVDYKSFVPLTETIMVKKTNLEVQMGEASLTATMFKLDDLSKPLNTAKVTLANTLAAVQTMSVSSQSTTEFENSTLYRGFIQPAMLAYPKAEANELLPSSIDVNHRIEKEDPGFTPHYVFTLATDTHCHFDFSRGNKLNLWTAGDGNDLVRSHSVLALGPDCRSTHASKFICPGAIYTAVDEVMGQATCRFIHGTCATAYLEMDFLQNVIAPTSADSSTSFLYIRIEVKELSSKKVEATATVYAVPTGAAAARTKWRDWASSFPVVAHGKGLFIVMARFNKSQL